MTRTSRRGGRTLTVEQFEDRLVPDLGFGSAFHFGGDSSQTGYSVAADGAGNTYVSGVFVDQVEVAPGQILSNSPGNSGTFVAKYTASGDLLWAQRLAQGYTDLTLDGNNNVYVTGRLIGTATFGSTTLTSQGYADVFLTKLNTDGVFQWATRFGSAVDPDPSGTGTEWGYGVDVDGAGNVYTTGQLFNEPGGSGSRLFVSRHDTNGNLVWLKTASSSIASVSGGADVAVSAAGAVWVTGSYAGTVDFNPGPGTNNLRSVRNTPDAFVLKLDAVTGNYVWAGSLGGSGGAYPGGATRGMTPVQASPWMTLRATCTSPARSGPPATTSTPVGVN